jgi:hypothetical protein
MSAVLDSLQAQGIRTDENSWDSDAAVIWSVLWNGRMAKNQQVYQHYREQGRPVIVIEIGALYRGNTWKVAVNHVTNQGYYGHLDNLDWDRPHQLGVSLAYQAITQPYVIVAAQHNRSLQVAGIDTNQWILDTVNQIRQHTDRPIHIRPHPRCALKLPYVPHGAKIEQPRLLPNTYDSYDMHYNCHAVFNLNSGPGIQAAIAGVRPVVHESSLASPVSMLVKDIEKPYDVDRQLWLTQICHTEYTVQELQRGTWLKRIQSALET